MKAKEFRKQNGSLNNTDVAMCIFIIWCYKRNPGKCEHKSTNSHETIPKYPFVPFISKPSRNPRKKRRRNPSTVHGNKSIAAPGLKPLLHLLPLHGVA
jgi:hypothetical protein